MLLAGQAAVDAAHRRSVAGELINQARNFSPVEGAVGYFARQHVRPGSKPGKRLLSTHAVGGLHEWAVLKNKHDDWVKSTIDVKQAFYGAYEVFGILQGRPTFAFGERRTIVVDALEPRDQ